MLGPELPPRQAVGKRGEHRAGPPLLLLLLGVIPMLVVLLPRLLPRWLLSVGCLMEGEHLARPQELKVLRPPRTSKVEEDKARTPG